MQRYSETFSHEEEHIDDEMTLLQANIDDVNPELIPYVMEKLFEHGANDVYTQPILMKKGRSGFMINVLCDNEKIDELEPILFKETTTIGIRRLPTTVHRLGRRMDAVETVWGPIPVKIAKYQNEIVQISPEYEDCKKVALQYDVPLKTVYGQTIKEIQKQFHINNGISKDVSEHDGKGTNHK